MRLWGCSDRSSADDLIQDVLAKLFAQDRRVLTCFRGRDTVSLQAYLRVIAARVTTDYYRGKEPPAWSLDDPQLSPSVIDNHASHEIEQKLLLDRVEQCLKDQRERDRWIFWLYHRQGFTPRSISALPGLSMGRSGIETLLYRLTKLVAECVKKTGRASEGLPA
jgi:RNA polymerase sigma factor (sigma-70 family)